MPDEQKDILLIPEFDLRVLLDFLSDQIKHFVVVCLKQSSPVFGQLLIDVMGPSLDRNRR
jgi:hypothetical protein